MFWALYRYIKEKDPLHKELTVTQMYRSHGTISQVLRRTDMVEEELRAEVSATGGCEKRETIGNNLVQEAGVGDVAKVMMGEAKRRWQGRRLRSWLGRERGSVGSKTAIDGWMKSNLTSSAPFLFCSHHWENWGHLSFSYCSGCWERQGMTLMTIISSTYSSSAKKG